MTEASLIRTSFKNVFARGGMAVVLIGLLGLSSCADLDPLQQKMLSGGAIGVVVGTVGVAATGGCIPCGAAIGGLVGVGAGYLLDQLDKSTKSSPGPQPQNYQGGYNNAPPPPPGPPGGGY